jgi:copper chaperone CopZ
MLLEGIEDDLPGVERAEASLKKNQLKVTFDDTVISEKNILAAVREEGYDAHPIGGSNG